MFQCEHCGAELEKDSNMCPVCGYDRALAKNLRLEYAEKTLDVLEKYGAADKPRQSAASVVGFILGLASFFCGCNIILAIMAIAFSCESGQNLTTRKNAFSRAGQILGVISILLFVIALILYFAAHINIFNYVR